MTTGRSDQLATAAPATPPRLRRVLGLVVAAVCGASIAVQSRINAELGGRIHDAIGAALISFTVGLVVLVGLVVAVPVNRRGVRRLFTALRGRAGDGIPALSWWHCLGGLSGAYLVLTQGLVAGVLGVAIFTVALVGGQSASGLLVDRVGLGPGGAQRITVFRVLGAVLAVLAVGIAVADRLGADGQVALAALPALAGIALAVQQAVTGRVSATAGAPITAAMVNFLVGAIGLAIALAVEVTIRGLPGALPADPVLYLGGLLGIVAIGGAGWMVGTTGVLLFGLASISGQLVAALVLDAVLPVSGGHLAPSTFLGTGLTFVAVLLAALPGRRR